MEEIKKSRRGFAIMDKTRQREIASKGGRVAHDRGTAHHFDSTQAALAARKAHELGAAHQFTSDEARAAGRKGGFARAAKLRAQLHVASSALQHARDSISAELRPTAN